MMSSWVRCDFASARRGAATARPGSSRCPSPRPPSPSAAARPERRHRREAPAVRAAAAAGRPAAHADDPERRPPTARAQGERAQTVAPELLRQERQQRVAHQGRAPVEIGPVARPRLELRPHRQERQHARGSRARTAERRAARRRDDERRPPHAPRAPPAYEASASPCTRPAASGVAPGRRGRERARAPARAPCSRAEDATARAARVTPACEASPDWLTGRALIAPAARLRERVVDHLLRSLGSAQRRCWWVESWCSGSK